jgi:stearoyl-CoA desaturase (delta-9 desaturase)
MQHQNYVALAVITGFVLPTIIASRWGNAIGGLFYAGHISKLMTWHTTFCINSFAHWIGSQDYSLEFTARGNLILAILTNGEGNDFQLFPLLIF